MNAQASRTVLLMSLPPPYGGYIQNSNLIGSNISMDELTRKLIIAEAKIKNCKRVGSSNKASQDMEEVDLNIVEGLGIGNPKVISVLDVY